MTEKTKAQEITDKFRKQINAINEAFNDLKRLRMHEVKKAYPEGKKITIIPYLCTPNLTIEVVCTGVYYECGHGGGASIVVHDPKTNINYELNIENVVSDTWASEDTV